MSIAQRSHLQAMRTFHMVKGDILLAAGELQAANDQYNKALAIQKQLS